MDIISGIYEIRNMINGNVYIGSSVNIYSRFSAHKHALNLNKHHSRYLQRSWNLHGCDSFSFQVLEQCKEDILLQREQYYLDTFKPEYNICQVAGSPLGIKHTEETRMNMSRARMGNQYAKGHKVSDEAKEKISASSRGRVASQETREKMSKSRIGEKRTQETRKRMSIVQRIAQIGKVLSQETKDRISASMKGVKKSPETIERMRKAQRKFREQQKNTEKNND